MRVIGIFATAAAVIVTGCVSYGPSGAAYEQAIAGGTPIAEGAVVASCTAAWIPNTSGPAGLNVMAMKTGGALVLTTNSLLWEQWDPDAATYRPTRKIRLANVRNVSTHPYPGPSDLLIAVESAEFQQDAFIAFRSGKGPERCPAIADKLKRLTAPRATHPT